MRPSKSLGNLLHHHSKSTAKLSGLQDTKYYPPDAEQYELLEEVGKGVSATVYLVWCKTAQEHVAIKALNLEALNSPLEDIMLETRTMKAYRNEHLLPLYCSFVNGQQLWMVMPYMEGGSVAHLMRHSQPDGLEEVLIATIMKPVLQALAYMHERSGIHRDVKAGNVLGISMGSSEGGGYANESGQLLGWINELCYIKIDTNPEAPTDPWTKGSHTGISHMYLGQRGATKLAAKAGVKLPENMVSPLPDMCTIKHEQHANCLKLIQKAMADPSQKEYVKDLYITVGVYLGYALAQYSEFYRINHVMILGRVSKGDGGDLMLDTAKEVLMKEFPQYGHIQFHTADDHFKAVGQCIAAAALPTLQ